MPEKDLEREIEEIKAIMSKVILPIKRKRVFGSLSLEKTQRHRDWNEGYAECEQDFLETNYEILAQALATHIKKNYVKRDRIRLDEDKIIKIIHKAPIYYQTNFDGTQINWGNLAKAIAQADVAKEE